MGRRWPWARRATSIDGGHEGGLAQVLRDRRGAVLSGRDPRFPGGVARGPGESTAVRGLVGLARTRFGRALRAGALGRRTSTVARLQGPGQGGAGWRATRGGARRVRSERRALGRCRGGVLRSAPCPARRARGAHLRFPALLPV